MQKMIKKKRIGTDSYSNVKNWFEIQKKIKNDKKGRLLKNIFVVKTAMQHRLTANSGYSGEKCYFRDQETNNKADKFAS